MNRSIEQNISSKTVQKMCVTNLFHLLQLSVLARKLRSAAKEIEALSYKCESETVLRSALTDLQVITHNLAEASPKDGPFCKEQNVAVPITKKRVKLAKRRGCKSK